MNHDDSPRFLLVEDDQPLADSLGKVLRTEGYRVEHVAEGGAGMERVSQDDFDLVITDMRLPGMGGLELVQRVHQMRPELPIVLLTAHGTSETAIEATKRGAFDYLLKPFAMPELLGIVARALEQKRTPRGAPEPAVNASGARMVGRSRAMQELFKEIGRVAPQNVTVLIRGETGTGKELVARALWRHSGRESKPFLAINCAAIPDTLLESELFGHERGAFTGADRRRPGRFEQANGGTLFLDEIGDVSAATQVRLLRVLQERTIQRVGGRDTIPIDVRVIAATHTNIEEAIRAGRFREDLFYRLSAVQIRVPALRDRPEDVPLLARHFADRIAATLGLPPATLRAAALDRLGRHAWPGNVRELENVIRRALIAARGFDISLAGIEEALAGALNHSDSLAQTVSGLVSEMLQEAVRAGHGGAHAAVVATVEAELLRQAMNMAAGNKSRVARWLGLSRLTLRERLERHGFGKATIDSASA